MTHIVDVAIVGAGFGGLALADRLAEDGLDDVVLFERGDGVGGTWSANSYPGAACDVPSHLYSLSTAPNPEWSGPTLPNPRSSATSRTCYDRMDVRPKVQLGTDIVAATWSESDMCWGLRDRKGGRFEASVLVTATGIFNSPSVPALSGLDRFEGTQFHSARWNHDHDLTGAGWRS